MKKRNLFLLVLFGLIIVIMSNSVLAINGFDFKAASEQWITWTQEIFGPFFSVFLGGTGELLFERILFLFILLSIVYIVLGNIPVIADNIGARWIITIAVSLLSTRFLTETQLVKGILLPYGVLGIALTAGIPIIILFYFINKDTLQQ